MKLNNLKKLAKRSFELITNGKFSWIPSSLAFQFFISFIPLLFVVIIFITQHIINDKYIISTLSKIETIGPMINDFIHYVKHDFSNINLITIIVLVGYSIYLSSGAISGIMYAVELFYGFQQRNFILTKVIAVLINILLIFLILLTVLVINVLPNILLLLNINIGYNYLLVMLLPILFIIILSVFYMVGVFQVKLRNLYKGALFSTIAIYIIILGANFLLFSKNRDLIYGSLASMILVAYFIYFVSQFIYFGLSINVADYQLKQEGAYEEHSRKSRKTRKRS
jgi:uncharacterized BrkB/YihY/UPF0761 family membrane protein